MFSTRCAGIGFAQAALIMLAQACVLPPPGEELPELVNRPPRIDPLTLVPSAFFGPFRIKSSLGCEFQATVGDPDNDTLYTRVFVDYRSSTNRTPQPAIFTLDPTRREVAITFEPDISLLVAGSEPHNVELLVADRPFLPTSADPGGRNVETDGLVDSFVWTILVDEGIRECGE